ncbi:MAG: MBL fold metallo-hydrolase [Opitutaceae bacterium]|nr:MBL fold metallo-hydrolase [Opitutaceae bacterium]
MPKIPIEDNFTDVLGKAQRGLHLSDHSLAAQAGVTLAALANVQSGRVDEATLRSLARPLHLGADALVALARRQWYPPQPSFPRGFAMFNTAYAEMTVNSFLVWDSRSRLAAAFDTGATASSMLDTIQAEHLTVRYIFLTHTHEDHTADLDRLARETGAEVWASEREPAAHPGARTFPEGAYFHLGAIAIKTLLTWGHSPGLTTYYITGLNWPVAIVGDSLFASSMGGSREHYREQHRNNVKKILSLPADTVICAGHGPLTTVAQEKLHNPFFAS